VIGRAITGLAVACAIGGALATAGTAGAALPDGRTYELVSTTAAPYGEPYVPIYPGGVFINSPVSIYQAALGGDALAYAGGGAETGGTGLLATGAPGNEWLATRGQDGWKTTVLTPAPYAQQSGVKPLFQGFSQDLYSGIVDSGALPPSAGVPGGCAEQLYRRDNTTGTYTTLVPHPQATSQCGRPLFAGAAEGAEGLIFQSEAALAPGALEATEFPEGHSSHSVGEFVVNNPCEFGCNLYLLEHGSLQLVNVLTGAGATVPNATFGGYAGQDPPDFSNAISRDGSHIFWTDTQAGPDMGHVYVRENGTVTVQVSGNDPAQYWTASPDGRYALYTEGGALWSFDTTTETRQLLAGEGLHGEAAAVEGVIGMNSVGADASYVYFVASNVLAVNKNSHHDVAALGEPNLYLRHEGTIRFIATLAGEDNGLHDYHGTLNASFGDWRADVGARTTGVTPDGSHLAFESGRSLTGYDNHDLSTARKITEAYVYDATSGGLSCASCDPVGIAPSIEEENGLSTLPVSAPDFTSMRRWLSANGRRLFFDTPQQLVMQDRNGPHWDVYEWESAGEGSCAAPDASTVTDGCTYLLSGGEGESDSVLADADVEGNNVFFLHRGSLGGAQISNERDELYDARVGGGFTEASTGCADGGCSQAPAAPAGYSIPATVSASGSGNLPAAAPVPVKQSRAAPSALKRALAHCKKERPASRRKRCETKARLRYRTKRPAHARARNGRS